MSFPLFIFILIGIILFIFIAFLIYSIFYPEAISNPLIIWTNFYSNLVVLKHKHDDYLILKQEKLLEQQEIIKRNQEEKDKVVFPVVLRTPIPVDDSEVRCLRCNSIQIHAEKRGWTLLSGFIGSSTIYMTCLKCGCRFKPGEKRFYK